MGQNELERVKADLEVMKTAAGIGRIYTLKDIRLNIVGGVIGLLLSALDVFVIKSLNMFISLFVIFAIMFLAYIVENIGKQEETTAQRQPKSYQWVIFAIGCLFMMGYMLWEERFNLPQEMYLGIFMMFWGTVLAIESYWRTRKAYEITPFIWIIIFGALVPLYPSHILMIFGLLFAVGSFAYAGIIAHVIRRQKVSNDTD